MESKGDRKPLRQGRCFGDGNSQARTQGGFTIDSGRWAGAENLPVATDPDSRQGSIEWGPWTQHRARRSSGNPIHHFLQHHRHELVARCKAKVAERPQRAATTEQLANGVPLFLSQLIWTLQAENDGQAAAGILISGPAGGDVTALSEIGVTATAHGQQLLQLGDSVDQVVHDYGDLCQSITDLAVEREAPFSADEFRTLNRCLDNAIADAVTAFVAPCDATVAVQHSAEAAQRLGYLAHQLRNSLQTATMAFTALESGKLPSAGRPAPC